MQDEPNTHASLKTAVQTMKTPEKTTFKVHLFTTMYAKKITWDKMRPINPDQRPQNLQIREHITIESVAGDPDEQYLAIPLVMFRIDVQQLLEISALSPRCN